MKKILCLLLLLSIIFVSCIDDPIEKEFYGYWTEINSENQPSQRVLMKMSYLGNNQFYLFGGTTLESDYVWLNDLWTIDLENKQWNEVSVLGDKPSERAVYGLASGNNNNFFIYGGSNNSGEILGDLWEYNSTENIWTQKNPLGDKPTPLLRQEMCYIGNNKIFLFGGGYEVLTNDTRIYDITANTWSKKELETLPSPRCDFGMDYSPISNKVVLFGGWVDLFQVDNETWEYDLSKDEWTEINIKGDKPTTRCDFELKYIGNDLFLLFGGLSPEFDGNADDTWIYDMSDQTWTEVDILGESKPIARDSYGMASNGDGKVLLFGGGDNWSNYFNDTWVFELVEQGNDE